MTTCTLTGTLTVAGRTVPLLDAAVTLDQGWAPYVAVTAVVAYDADLFAATDPRVMVRATLILDQAWAHLEPLTALDALWAGHTLATLDALWAGGTVATLDALWAGDRWGNAAWRDPETLTANVHLRRRAADRAAGTITLSTASDELALQESRGWAITYAAEPLLTRLGSLVGQADMLTGASIALGDLATAVCPAGSWPRSTDCWTMLRDSVEPIGVRVWCDESRTWRARRPLEWYPTPVHTLARVIGVDDVTDRDDDWADSGMWLVGASLLELPDDLPGGHHRTIVDTDAETTGVLTVDPHAVQAWRSSQGRHATITAQADLAVRPGHGATADLFGVGGEVEQVVFRLAAATMTVTTRDTGV